MVLCKGRGTSPREHPPCLTPPAAHLTSQTLGPLHVASLAGDQSGFCGHSPGPPSGEGAVTTLAICPAGSVPACLIHLDKCSLLSQAQILGSNGFYAGGR